MAKIRRGYRDFFATNEDLFYGVLRGLPSRIFYFPIQPSNHHIERKIHYLSLEKWAEQGEPRACLELGNRYFKGEEVGQDYEKAFYYYRKGAELGDASCMATLGRCYYWGEGVELNLERAAYFYEQAAEAGDTGAMYSIGMCYTSGTGVSRNVTKALSWLERAAEKGCSEAFISLGNLYYYGYLVGQDRDRAFHYFQRAAEESNPISKLYLSACYEEGLGVDKDLDKAKTYLSEAYNEIRKRAVLREDPDAIFWMGYFHCFGLPLIGLEQDYFEAANWFEDAAKKGHIYAQNYLGILYYFGLGKIADSNIASNYFSMAADRMDPSGLCNLGIVYQKGRGAKQDLWKAAEYHNKAAYLGNFISQAILGKMYMQGKIVTKNYSQAVRWLEESWKNGYSGAFAPLGHCYLKGLGVEQDQKKAFQLYQEGAAQDDLEAKVSMAECLIEGWGTKCDFNRASEILESVCYYEKKYRENHVFAIFREGPGRYSEWENPLDEEKLKLYARAYYLLGLLYYAKKGVGKADPYKTMPMLRMAEKLGYKGEGRALNELIAEVEGACNHNYRLEIRRGKCTRMGDYHIFIHHADGNEEEVQFNSSRQKFCYMLLMFFASNKYSMPGLMAPYFCYARERLISLAIFTKMRTSDVEKWIDDFIYDGNYHYDPQKYSNEFGRTRLHLRESMNEDELGLFGVRRASGEVNIRYIAASPQQIIIPEELQQYARNLPTLAHMKKFDEYRHRTADYGKFLQRFEKKLEIWDDDSLANE